eukprot:6194606-Pleurochrysis_carterae.AAC.1
MNQHRARSCAPAATGAMCVARAMDGSASSPVFLNSSEVSLWRRDLSRNLAHALGRVPDIIKRSVGSRTMCCLLILLEGGYAHLTGCMPTCNEAWGNTGKQYTRQNTAFSADMALVYLIIYKVTININATIPKRTAKVPLPITIISFCQLAKPFYTNFPRPSQKPARVATTN